MIQYYIIISVVAIIGLIILFNLFFRNTKNKLSGTFSPPALCGKGSYSVTGNTPCMSCPENAVCENDGTSLLNITCKRDYTKYVTIAGVISCVKEDNDEFY